MSSDHVARFQNLEQNQGSSLRGFDTRYITPTANFLQSPAPCNAAWKISTKSKSKITKAKVQLKTEIVIIFSVKETWGATYCFVTETLNMFVKVQFKMQF